MCNFPRGTRTNAAACALTAAMRATEFETTSHRAFQEKRARLFHPRKNFACNLAVHWIKVSPRPKSGQEKTAMMIDWNEYHKQVGARIGDVMKLSPDTVRGYQTLSNANAKASLIGEKTRQLISLAVAVTTQCDGDRKS